MDVRELEMAMRGLGLNPSPAEVEQILAAADTDMSGEIDFDEFVAAVSGGAGSGQARAFFSGVLNAQGAAAPPARGAAGGGVANQQQLPVGWAERSHEGRPYFVNRTTGEKSWQRPTAELYLRGPALSRVAVRLAYQTDGWRGRAKS
eukprot:COSAG04_NODE_1092_length_8322_cov_1.935547_1_plen_146_part_10